jgi:hypothetical protein
MVKRWFTRIREQKSVVLRRQTVIGVLTPVLIVALVYLTRPLLWPGGGGFGKDETVATESVEKDAKGNPVKKTTKYDDGKTLWDWLTVVGVPIYITFLGIAYQLIQQNRAVKVAQEQRERDEKLAKEQREIAADETKEEVLQVYFDRLSMLLVDKNLLAIASKVYAPETQGNEGQSKNEATLEEQELLDSAVDVIRARTLSILRRFENDQDRKTSVIRFLIEADIVNKLRLSLRGADLSGANLFAADLSGADLKGANLKGANLKGANLLEADLIEANLSGANLSGATLKGAKLTLANLSAVNLKMADLLGADLLGAELLGANLSGARFRNRDLTEVEKADFKARGAICVDPPNSDLPRSVKH